ncbi:hypothetical protein CPC16_010286 [Podila verticillata]|nr:hypothetical protein CPC16_010286 [Podila verticillata]KAI9234854.1 MAG: ubiquitin-2 like Rad60 SUMO-like-domain-containing protein [Podila humilis]
MADSDEEPVVPRRPQPKPKPRSRRMGAKNADSMGSPNRTPSSSNSNSTNDLSTSPTQHSRIRVIEDDFFSKAKSYRPFRREVPQPEFEEGLEPLEKEEVLDAVSSSRELPTFDFEEEEEEIRQTARAKAKADTELKRKRELSLTPPPEAPVIHYKPTYDTHKPLPQPSKYDTIDLDDDDDDVQELDPELVSIAQKLSKRSGLTRNASDDAMISPTLQPNSFFSSSSQPGSGLQSPNPMFSPSSQEHSGPQETATPVESTPVIDINIMIRKIRDPRLVVPPDMEQVMRAIEAPIKFIIKSDQAFRMSMELYCRQKHTQLAEVVFALRGNRLLPSSTPQTVDCPRIAVVDVYEADAFKYYKEQEKLQEAQRLAQMEMELAQLQRQQEIEKKREEEASAKALEQASGANDEGDDEEEEEVEEEFLFIKLRGLDTQDEKLKVKKSTTVEAVLKHYRKLKKLDADTLVTLSWDDEDLDPASTIGDTDVEDGDMLTVRIG